MTVRPTVVVLELMDERRYAEIFDFWRRAVQHGFASRESHPCAPYRRGFAHAFSYGHGVYDYCEEFAGEMMWGGDEIIFRDLSMPVWRLSATGAFEPLFRKRGYREDAQERAREVLREALMQVRLGEMVSFMPRGPLEFCVDDYTYHARFEGDFAEFLGMEWVSHNQMTVLTQRFHGGLLI